MTCAGPVLRDGSRKVDHEATGVPIAAVRTISMRRPKNDAVASAVLRSRMWPAGSPREKTVSERPLTTETRTLSEPVSGKSRAESVGSS